jgi:2-dehydropantoate 2-reductase
MRVLCYGAGAVGSLLGGRLSLAGVDVTLLGRVRHVAAVRTWGLLLEDPAGRARCKAVDSVTSLEDLRDPPDLIIVSVKSYDTPRALGELRPLLAGSRAVVLSVQNGVGNEEALAEVAGPDRTLAGALTVSVSLPRPGVVRQHTAGGGLGLAPVGARAPVGEVAALFSRAGVATRVYPDYRAMKWSKLLLNLVTNASVAILDLPPARVVAHPGLFRLERDAFREAVRVMRAFGLRAVSLPGYPVPALVSLMASPPWIARPLLARRIGRGRGEKMPSLWQDLERGKAQSEVEVLNGAVVREGGRLGEPTPVNRVLATVLGDLARGTKRREDFRGNPDALLRLAYGIPPKGSSEPQET